MKRARLVFLSVLVAAIAARADLIWVANAGAGTVSVIDTQKANQVVASITLGAGSVPVEVAHSPFHPQVYVTDPGRASLWVLDRVAKAVVREIPLSIVEPFGLAVHPLGNRIYVANADGGVTAGMISVVDPERRREIATIDISTQGLTSLDVALTPVRANILYVACNGTDSIAGVNTRTNGPLGAPFPVNLNSAANAPFAIALRQDNAFVYVCDDDPTGAASELVVLDVPTLSPNVVALAAGQRATDVTVHPNRRRAYVATGAGGRVRILDTELSAFVQDVVNIPAGSVPAKVAFNGLGTLGTFTEQTGGGAMLFQPLANVVTSPVLATGGTPFGCSIVPVTSDPIGAARRRRQLRGR